MEAVLTKGVDDFSFLHQENNRILPSKFQEWIKDKHIYTEIVFQLINEDPFVIKIFTNERCESNQFQVEEKMEYSLIKLFTPS